MPLFLDVLKKSFTSRKKAKIESDGSLMGTKDVDTKRVNEAVRNNRNKFPVDYMFELNKSELRD